jgi:pyruvate formate lyase activating enzyme
VGGELVLTTYGRSSGFCIDPIEKKPLAHFLPGTPVLSLGTAGCNLGCKFCQNWDISKSREMDTLAATAGPEAVVAAAKRTDCRSIAFTYNDPTIWAEYAIDIAKVARAEGIKTVAVTAGYISEEPRKEFYQWMDAANVDLKAFTETFYRKLTQTQLQPVLDTLMYLKRETDVWFEITNLLIPGENDSPGETRAMCRWIVEQLGDEVPVHFTAFHPDFKMMDTPPTPHETLVKAREIALGEGIKYAYVGNVFDSPRESTYCPQCGELLIERSWYEIGAYKLAGNRCGSCGTVIAGVFEDRPGRWGRARLAVRVGGSSGG